MVGQANVEGVLPPSPPRTTCSEWTANKEYMCMVKGRYLLCGVYVTPQVGLVLSVLPVQHQKEGLNQ